MSAPGCDRWRDALALDALGALEDDERAGLLAHLDGCASCRELHRELRETAGALASVDPAAVAETASVPPALTADVLGTLHAEAHRSRRRRRAALALASVGAVAASVALVLVLVLPGAAPGTGSRRIELSSLSTSAATATAVLSSRPWGTSIDFAERGLPAGTVYEVSMRTRDGAWWPTGSYRGAGGRLVVAQMACAVPTDEITGIRVSAGGGATVLESTAAPGTTW